MMTTSFLKIFRRNFRRNAVFSSINLFGLSVGIAASIFILQIIAFELSFDNFVFRKKHIFRILPSDIEGSINHVRTPGILGPFVESQLPEVENFVRLTTWGEGVVRFEDVELRVGDAASVYVTDNRIFDFFSYKIIKGDPKGPLLNSNTAVVTESLAKRIFGDRDPVGQTISYQIGSKADYVVTAVMEDLPANSNLKFRMLLSIVNVLEANTRHSNWNGPEIFETYVMLSDPQASDKVQKAIIDIYQENTSDEQKLFRLQPLDDVHLYSADLWEPGISYGTRGDVRMIYFLVIIALAILLISWVNFINMTTVRSMDRNKEIGVKKCMGASRGQLITQFIFESAMFNTLAIVLAIGVVAALFPHLKDLFMIQSDFIGLLFNRGFMLVLLGIFLFGILFSGVYPAYAISSLNLLSALKGVVKVSSNNSLNTKNIFLVFQYAVSILLIAGSVAVLRQISYMTNADAGIDFENVVLVSNPTFLNFDSTVLRDAASFRNELLRTQEVEGVSLSNFPGAPFFASSYGRRKNSSERFEVSISYIDEDFINTYRVPILAGRNLSEDNRTDHDEAILINESAVQLYGFESPEDAIGQQIIFGRWGVRTIVGVVYDYHQEYLRKPIRPVVFLMISYSPHLYYSIRIKDRSAVDMIASHYARFFPDYPFQFDFVKSIYAKQFSSEMKFGRICITLSLVAVCLSCIGLYAVSGYSISQKFKEIGIRKVLGATEWQLSLLLSRTYLLILVFASTIALPLAYYAVVSWLNGFASKIDIGISFFLLPFCIVLPIIVVTISFNVIRAASNNPTLILRYE